MQAPQSIKMLSERIASMIMNDADLLQEFQSLSAGGTKKAPAAKRKTKKQLLAEAEMELTNYSIRSKK